MRLNQLGKEVDNKKKLFKKGIDCFNQRNYYDAHEYWEELWSEYYLPDANFIQGLIQLSVGYFHISNLNINGARGLLNKCRPKLLEFSPEYKTLNVLHILESVDSSLKFLDNNPDLSKFDWSLVPNL